jgi:hypothetical protein
MRLLHMRRSGAGKRAERLVEWLVAGWSCVGWGGIGEVGEGYLTYPIFIFIFFFYLVLRSRKFA